MRNSITKIVYRKHKYYIEIYFFEWYGCIHFLSPITIVHFLFLLHLFFDTPPFFVENGHF